MKQETTPIGYFIFKSPFRSVRTGVGMRTRIILLRVTEVLFVIALVTL